MRTDASGKVIKISHPDQQENIRNTRKSLKVLQQTATDKENLAGRTVHPKLAKELATKLSSDSSSLSEPKHKIKLSHKSTQTGSGTKVDVKDLTSEAGPSENYWQLLAEQRRIALDESLDENRKLIEENVALRDENRICKEMLDESKSLVEVLTEMLNEKNEEEEEDSSEQEKPGTSGDQ